MQPTETTPRRTLRDRLFAPVDIAFLVFFRIAFGAIMLWEVWRYFAYDRIKRYYITPDIHFTYYGFEWVKPWEGDGMYLHFYALGFLALCITIGACYRVATTLFFLGFAYVFLLDQTNYLNHFYLVTLLAFLLIIVPAHRAFSVDAWLRPRLRSSVVPAWTLGLLRAQIGCAYFFGGIAKISPDWLQGEPMRMWLAKRTDFPVLGPYFHEEWMIYIFVLGGLLLDLLIVPLLLWRRTRLLAFLAGVGFHLMNSQLFSIGIFPWLMLCATLLFFPHDLPRRLWHALRRKAAPATPDETPVHSVWSRGQTVVLVFLTVYLAVQVLMPLRHFAYPGNADWTEEGHRFAWHMKLRSKRASAMFMITQPATGLAIDVYPEDTLNSRQCDKMLTHPDMILQFCHRLAEEMRQRGHGQVEVRAEVMASLNGRERQLLVDPTVDLAKEKRSLAPAPWIMPLTKPLPRPGSSPRNSGPELAGD